MLMIGWYLDIEDLVNFIEFLIMICDFNMGKGQYNCGYYLNVEVDKLVNVVNEEIDLEKCSIMLKKVEEILYNEVVFVFFYF